MHEPSYFFVTSYGRTATLWLTRALNSHPDIQCSHGPSLYHDADPDGKHEGEEDFVQVQKTAASFYALSLQEILSALGSNTHKRCVGNVHAYTASNLNIKRIAEPASPPLRTVNLLRHPVTRIDSFWRRFQYEHTLNSPTSQWIDTESFKQPRFQQVLAELQTHHDVEMTAFDDKAFFIQLCKLPQTQVICRSTYRTL